MNVHIQFLPGCDVSRLRDLLQHDGWQVTAEDPGGLQVTHSQVRDQAEARRRLARQGLLTSPVVRIAFFD